MVANRKSKGPHPLIAKAIKLLGTQQALADAANLTQTQITRALNRKRGITAELAVSIDRATKGAVPKHLLRPDIFDAPLAAQPKKENHAPHH